MERGLSFSYFLRIMIAATGEWLEWSAPQRQEDRRRSGAACGKSPLTSVSIRSLNMCNDRYPVDGNNTRFRSISVMARVKVIRENWNLKYSACFILCPLRISYLDVPYSVSIVSKLRSPPGNILMLRNTDSVRFASVYRGSLLNLVSILGSRFCQSKCDKCSQ